MTMTTETTMSQTMSNPSGDMTAGDPTGDATPTDPGESSDSGPNDTSVGSTSMPAPGAPVFLSLQTNVSKITAGESVTFTAVLTDPDGVDDIVGGTLSDPTGMIGYGPFVAAGQEGTYSITVSWDAMQQAESIYFEGMDGMREFRAEFFDQAANKVSKDVSLTLTCAEGSACEGVCIDITMDGNHCGMCGMVCAGGCDNGKCAPSWSECVGFQEGYETCDQICAVSGETCVENGCGGNTVRAYGLESDCEKGQLAIVGPEPCDNVQMWPPNASVIQCCCGQ